MKSDNDNTSPMDYETFCSVLDALREEKDLEVNQTIINSLPIDDKVHLLLKILLSQKSHELKSMAISKLEMILSIGFNRNEFSERLVNDSNSYIVCSLAQRENEPHQQRLLALCVNLMSAINQEKTNKWETVKQMVSSCVTSYDNNLTNLIIEALVESPNLFGEELNQQLMQYNELMTFYLKDFKENPHLTLAATLLLRYLLLNHESNLSFDIFSKLVPLLMDAMKGLIITENGIPYLKNLQCILLKKQNIFRNNPTKIVEDVVIFLNTNNNIEKSVLNCVYGWITLLIVKFPEEIEKECIIYLSIIFQQMLNLQIESYKKNSKEWYTDVFDSNETRLSHDTISIHSNLMYISGALRCETVYPLLIETVSQLLKSSDWERIATGLDTLLILIETCKEKMETDPRILFHQVTPYLSHENPNVIRCAINLIGTLCVIYQDIRLIDFHFEVIALIINSAITQSSIIVKIASVYSIERISQIRKIDEFKRIAKIFLQLSQQLFDAIFNSDNIELINTLMNAVCKSLDSFYKQLEYDSAPFNPKLVRNLLRTLDKVYLIYGFDRHVHSLFYYIEKAACFRIPYEPDKIGKIIVDYIDDFNKTHNISPDLYQFEIQPCFFYLIKRMIAVFTTYLKPITPKLGTSFGKILSAINKQVTDMDIIKLQTLNRIPGQFGCSECISSEYDGGIKMIGEFVESWTITLGADMSPYIEIYLEILGELLEKLLYTQFCFSVADNIFRMLYCSFYRGGTEAVKKVWNVSVKPKILHILKNCSDSAKYDIVLEKFTNCILMDSYKDALNNDDIEAFADIIETTMIRLIKLNDSLPQCEKNDVEPKIISIQRTLDNLQNCLSSIVEFHNDKVIIVFIKMFKILAACLKSEYSDSFIYFSNFEIFDAFKFLSHDDIINTGLATIFFNFTTDVLLESVNNELLEDSISVLKMLKETIPEIHAQHIISLGPSKGSIIEELLLKE